VCVHAFQQLMINRLTGRRQVRKGTTARSISSSHIFVKWGSDRVLPHPPRRLRRPILPVTKEEVEAEKARLKVKGAPCKCVHHCTTAVMSPAAVVCGVLSDPCHRHHVTGISGVRSAEWSSPSRQEHDSVMHETCVQDP